MEQPVIRDNPARQRFELHIEGLVVFADYLRRAGVLVITHVEAPPDLRGKGAAGRLMQGVADIARAEGVKIEPLCPYAAVWIQRHPGYGDLLA